MPKPERMTTVDLRQSSKMLKPGMAGMSDEQFDLLSSSGEDWKNRLTKTSVFRSAAGTRNNWRYRTSKLMPKRVKPKSQHRTIRLQLRTLETAIMPTVKKL